ncbi:MAG: phosphohydrolase, partial [Bifidobacterium mongoliense]|nr:phosphohydrolase [Bifidobacterium mongoliense]
MTGFIPTLAQIDEMHHAISPSDAAYDLIHTHCVIVATITRQLVQRQNALFVRRCTLPQDVPELASRRPDAGAEPSPLMLDAPVVPPTDGVRDGTVPPRLLDA